jgi:predicted NBD/HSP70 family sugar kinase
MGFANLDADFLAQESIATAPNPEKFVADLVPRLRNLVRMRPEITCEGIGVSLPGRVDLETQKLAFAPNLRWHDFDLKAELEKAMGLPVELENAANSCALAEFWFGKHAIGVRNLVAITVSEGIGTGLILNHQLVQGSTGMAGEFGHTTLVENGLECPCGNRGCWEVYASNSAAIRYYVQAADRGRSVKATAQSRSELTFDDLLRLATQGDPRANKAIDEMAHYLGVGTALLVTGLAPDVIVLIGEVTRLWDRIGPTIEGLVKTRNITHSKTRIVRTDPSAQPRLRGTIALVLQKHFGAPSFA